jgi:hypothetical protein
MITGFNQTVLHPLGLMVLVVSVLAFFYRERQYVFFPFLILLLFVSTLQRVEIAGADFTLLRILLLFTLIRVYFKKEFYWFEFNIIDLIFIFWVTSTSIAQLFTLGNETLVFQIGRLIDVAIPYFLVRFLVRNETDIYQFMKYIVIISLLSVGFFLRGSNSYKFILNIWWCAGAHSGKKWIWSIASTRRIFSPHFSWLFLGRGTSICLG